MYFCASCFSASVRVGLAACSRAMHVAVGRAEMRRRGTLRSLSMTTYSSSTRSDEQVRARRTWDPRLKPAMPGRGCRLAMPSAASRTSSALTLQQARDLREAAVHEVVEVVVDHPPGQRVLLAARVELDQQALAQVARSDARRLQRLHQPSARSRLSTIAAGPAPAATSSTEVTSQPRSSIEPTRNSAIVMCSSGRFRKWSCSSRLSASVVRVAGTFSRNSTLGLARRHVRCGRARRPACSPDQSIGSSSADPRPPRCSASSAGGPPSSRSSLLRDLVDFLEQRVLHAPPASGSAAARASAPAAA